MDRSGPWRNGAPRHAGSRGVCFIAAMKADSFHQPDGSFPIVRTGSQHADDSMRSECWENSLILVKGVYVCVIAELEAGW
jgi:hypothetical protein